MGLICPNLIPTLQVLLPSSKKRWDQNKNEHKNIYGDMHTCSARLFYEPTSSIWSHISIKGLCYCMYKSSYCMYKSSDKSFTFTSIKMRPERAWQIVEMHPTDTKSKTTDIEEDILSFMRFRNPSILFQFWHHLSSMLFLALDSLDQLHQQL
jgi:hypothetical protein